MVSHWISIHRAGYVSDSGLRYSLGAVRYGTRYLRAHSVSSIDGYNPALAPSCPRIYLAGSQRGSRMFLNLIPWSGSLPCPLPWLGWLALAFVKPE